MRENADGMVVFKYLCKQSTFYSMFTVILQNNFLHNQMNNILFAFDNF